MNGAGIFFLILFILLILAATGWVGFTRWQAHHRGLPPPPLSAYNPIAYFKKSGSSSGAGYSTGGSSRAGQLKEWVQDKFQSVRGGGGVGGGSSQARHDDGTGGYESSRRGFGPLHGNDDGAWDDRVGGYHGGGGGGGAGGMGGGHGGRNEYEEQELGLHPGERYGGGGGHDGYEAPGTYGGQHGGEGRGRSRTREDENTAYHGAQSYGQHHGGGDNPFGDGAERSDLRGVSPRPVDNDGGYGHTRQKSSLDYDRGRNERRSMFQEDM